MCLAVYIYIYFSVQVIDVTDVNNPTERESFWIEKLKTYIPMGLNVREGN